MTTREELLFHAKIAEQLERYTELVRATWRHFTLSKLSIVFNCQHARKQSRGRTDVDASCFHG